MGLEMNRRMFLGGLAAAAIPARAAVPAPTAPVAIAKSKSYSESLPVLTKLMDQIGGLGRIAKNKTVVIKINFTGGPTTRLGYMPQSRTYWTNPYHVGAMITLLDKAGARRIRIAEGCDSPFESLEEWMYKASWDVNALKNAAPRVEFVNTNIGYPGKKPYSRFMVPNGGHLFPGYDLNTVFDECDVLVSMTKAKEHTTAGITISMKNLFGMTPNCIYGGGASGRDEPLPAPRGGRQQILHGGSGQPPKSSLPELDPKSPRRDTYRIPRCVADINAARPLHLAVMDAVETMSGGEGPWSPGARPCAPGFVFAGTNAVTVDAVGMALLGFDPMADRGKPPFDDCDSSLRLAEELGVGTRDLKRIEVIGVPIAEAKFDIRAVPGGDYSRRQPRPDQPGRGPGGPGRSGQPAQPGQIPGRG
jgi:uncharacterized protein (DUF362 family)